MTNLTTFFDIYEQMQGHNLSVAAEYTKSEHCNTYLVELSESDLLAEFEELFKNISTLKEYRGLVDVIIDIKESLTIRVLYVLFQALVSVEERVWATADMYPPVRDIVMSHIDMLLDRYSEFALALESDLVAWTKEKGYFSDPAKYAFIAERNAIYSDYIVLAGSVINAFAD